jgi:hypothetical protein
VTIGTMLVDVDLLVTVWSGLLQCIVVHCNVFDESVGCIDGWSRAMTVRQRVASSGGRLDECGSYGGCTLLSDCGCNPDRRIGIFYHV